MLQWTLSGKQDKVSYNLQYSSHLLKNTSHVTPPQCWFTYHLFAIGHFRAPPGLGIKTRLSAQPLIWKWFFILMQINSHFHKKGCALGLILKVRVFGTRKWPIKLESQHWRRREEVLSGKRSISWLSRHDMKNPQFQSTVSTKLDEYCRSFQHLYSRSLHWWRDNLAFLANFNLLMCQKGLNEHRKLKKRKNR